MKKNLLILCLLFLAARGYSQQFSQYNTGTLYDSFENPSQRAFVPDTSKTYASNFLLPNFNANFLLKGDAQTSLISRMFGAKYNNSALQVGQGKYNYANFNANAYSVMFKMFASLNGDEEIGIFANTRGEGRGSVTDETLALLNGPGAFSNNIYDNIFNDNYYYQLYNSIGLTYREKLSKQVSIGFKVSALMGIAYSKLNIYESHIDFDKANDAAEISLRGKYFESKGPGNLDDRSFLPTLRSPGAQISIGTSYRTEDGIIFQGNIKDLGFIHWYSGSFVSNFDGSNQLVDISSSKREENIYNGTYKIYHDSKVNQSFTTYTNGKFEFSASKLYYLSPDYNLRYTPTLIVQKELLYNGTVGALVNHFQYDNYHASVTFSYDNLNLFNAGLQFMVRSYNTEFFIGSERLLQSAQLGSAVINHGSSYTNGSYTGADFFIGFSVKFGPVIEHPMNASTIPDGEKGFLGRLWNRFFKTNW